MVVGSGSGMAKGHEITSGGTTVIAQDQDTMGGRFDKNPGVCWRPYRGERVGRGAVGE